MPVESSTAIHGKKFGLRHKYLLFWAETRLPPDHLNTSPK